MLPRRAERAERCAAGPPGGAADVEGAPNGLRGAGLAMVRLLSLRRELRVTRPTICTDWNGGAPPSHHCIPDRYIPVQDPREFKVVVIVVVPAHGQWSAGGWKVGKLESWKVGKLES